MTDSAQAISGSAQTDARRHELHWAVAGLANLGVICVLAFGFWYLLIDPKWAVAHTYSQPFFVVLFWAILLVVFIGFNLEFYGFDRLPQPIRGLAMIAVTLGLAIGITALLTTWWGRYDPAYATSRAAGNGYITAQIYVLFGFFTYLTVVINWDHWPFRDLGLKQPWLGITEILAVTGVTMILNNLLAMPNLAAWAKPGHYVIELNTVIGWFYSVIVAALITGLITENWPWRLAGSRGRQAAASLVGNLVLGTAIYFIFLALVKTIIGSATVSTLGPVINQFPAQLGVCWAFWMILWSNCFGNNPTWLSEAANYAVRVALTFLLGLGTFVFYYYFLAGTVLHEPVVAGSLHGNALGWMDWLVLWILFYVVYLGSIGIPGEPEVSADEPETVRTQLADEPADEFASVHD